MTSTIPIILLLEKISPLLIELTFDLIGLFRGQYLIVGDSLEVVRLREKDPKEVKQVTKSPKQLKS